MKKLNILMLCVVVLYVTGCSCDTWVKFWGGEPEFECASHWAWKGKEPIQESVLHPCATPSIAKTMRSYPAREVVSLEKMAPKEVWVNQPFDYRIKVTNLTDTPLQNVMVKDCVPENLVIKDTEPKAAKMEKGDIHWVLGNLGANASQMITVNALASGRGTISSCAEVFYDSPICARITVVEPKIQLSKTAPVEVLQCDRIPLRYVIANTGTGHACDITIKDKLPAGLMTASNQDELTFAVKALAPGTSQEFRAMVDATKTGKFASKAVAMSQGIGKVESNLTETTVHKPVLAVTESGPASNYIGRPLKYEIIVANKGDGIAKDTVLEAMIPEGVRFEAATKGGRFTHSSPGKVTWNIGSLKPDETRKVTMTLSFDSAGALRTRAVARAYCAETVSDSAQTLLSGISAILIEVVDVSDPIEIGQNEVYVITVTNQGSKTGTNIQVSCMLEEGMQYISSIGPTAGTITGKALNFAPLPSLEPKARSTWRVTVKAIGTGDMRFKVIMNSDQLKRPVEETEATMFYE
jgi:uncharacterized repeat protein (TIGR01451 family)